MIGTMMNSMSCVVMLRVKNSIISVLTLVELQKKVTIVYSMKAKTHILNAFLKVKLFNFLNVVFN